MTNETSQPPTAWRYCGNQIKLWRERTGVTREELAKASNYEYETIKSMEQGRRRPTLRMLEVADELCGARGLLIAATDYLKPEKFVPFAVDFMQYEAVATVLSSFQNQLIPGLLQTEATARALFNANWPPPDDETLEERIATRLARQSLLETQTKSFNFVIDEAVLRRRVSDRETHVQQLRHLLAIGAPRHITIQVMPATGAHPGLNGAFVLLQTPEHEQLAYEEGQAMGRLYTDAQKVNMLAQRYAMILRRALNPEDSAQFITKLAEEL
ncbi:helix-turn-helix domain-containing protein [Kitasatospora sp. NPDC001175]|uniref:helix-turn-helix domain-containing protein n=1 Tax=Kitasatospora sp. NPDC001175 TaxID=3157103 RepID=UPI003D02C9A5